MRPVTAISIMLACSFIAASIALRVSSNPALSSFSIGIGWPITNWPRAKGLGIIKRSHPLARQNRSTDQHIGTIGLPAICAIDTGPAARIRAGPRGPSGVMETITVPETKHDRMSAIFQLVHSLYYSILQQFHRIPLMNEFFYYLNIL